MKLSIRHETTYRYDDQVRASIQYLRLTPHDSERQHILSWQLDLPRPVRAQIDPYGNILHVLTLDEPHEAIVIGARGQVEIDEHSEAEHDKLSALPFLRSTRLTTADEALRAFAHAHCKPRPERSGLITLMDAARAHRLPDRRHRRGQHRRRGLRRPCGVCQDHTHAFLACARTSACRRASSPATCTRRTTPTWSATPGRKPGWAMPGTASTSPTACPARSATSLAVGLTTWTPARSAACAVAAASRCTRASTSTCRRC